jgi:hypothetical protein
MRYDALMWNVLAERVFGMTASEYQQQDSATQARIRTRVRGSWVARVKVDNQRQIAVEELWHAGTQMTYGSMAPPEDDE